MRTLLQASLLWVRFVIFEILRGRIRSASRVRFAIPLFCVLSALPQALSTITGQVKDTTGAGLVGASVTITNTETNAVRTLTTGSDGRYSAPSLPAASYSVSAEKVGFETASRKGIVLVVGQTAIEDLTLPLGKFSQVITVTEDPPVVSLSTEQTSGLVGEKQVKELPLNGRSYDELMTLNPGIVNYTSQKAGSTGTSNSAIGNMFSASGRRPQESIFLLNGIEYTGASEINLSPGGTSGQLLGVDAVREFNVLTDTYGAEYGKRPGAQINVVTSSGTNQLHGTVYEFLRNSALDGRNFFDGPSIPPFERNEFGGALGGPVQKNRTFFFANYEGFRQRLGLSNVTLVPDNAARSGLLVGANGNPIRPAPGISQLLSLWPVQNGPELGGGIAESFNNPLQRTQENFGTTRIDHVFSPSDTLSAVYTVDDSGAHTPTVNPLSAITESLREQVVSLEETHVFSPQVLNTARAGFSRGAFYFSSQAPDVPSWVEGAPIGAAVIGGGTASNSATQISNAGTNVASNTVAVRNLFTYEDQVDINIGVHHIQAGAWVQRIQSNDNFAQAQYGQASFSSLTNFLQGNVSTFTAVPAPTALGWRSVEGAGYVQDRLKLTSN
ncbi:MAG TPA: carboxypeptidase-like regulatory domain-containing protein, partial [Bryobacteraceae bacterium]